MLGLLFISHVLFILILISNVLAAGIKDEDMSSDSGSEGMKMDTKEETSDALQSKDIENVISTAVSWHSDC